MVQRIWLLSSVVFIVAVSFGVCLGQPATQKADKPTTQLARQSLGGKAGEAAYQVKTAHPRLFIEDVRELAQRCEGALADDYAVVKQRADSAVQRGGIRSITNQWSIPEDLMNCGLAYLIERQRGRDALPYAEVIIKQWGDGSIISNPKGSNFG